MKKSQNLEIYIFNGIDSILTPLEKIDSCIAKSIKENKWYYAM